MDYLDIPFQNFDLVENNIDQLKLFIYSTVFWFTLFYIVNDILKFKSIEKKKADDVKNRIISIFHGLACVLLAIRSKQKHGSEFGLPNTHFQLGTVIISTAYFTYDLIACFYYGLADFGCVSHHVMVIVSYVSCIYQNYGAAEIMLALLFAEVSNSPMHIRMILRNFNLRYTKIYEIFEMIYMLSYIIARTTMIPFSQWPVLWTVNCPMIIKVMCVGLTFQSLYYIKEMYGILIKKYKQYLERSSKKISYFWFSENAKIKELSYANREVKQNIF